MAASSNMQRLKTVALPSTLMMIMTMIETKKNKFTDHVSFIFAAQNWLHPHPQ
jgi:hypothetical protein